MTNNVNNTFHNSIFLTAMYGQRWRRYQAISSHNLFHHTPVLRPINNTGYYYAEAWRGYAEPVVSSDRTLVRDAFSSYSAWCKEQSLICELLRLDPLGQLRDLAGDIPNGRIVDGQPVAVLDTPSDMKHYRKQLPAACRRNLRSAKRHLEVRLITSNNLNDLAAATMLHKKTLQRVQAADKWFVESNDLQSLSTLPEFVIIGVFNRLTGKIVSFAGSLTENGRLHVLLVGNNLQSDSKGASDLLYEAIVAHAVESGTKAHSPIHRIYFGGGRSLDGSDSLMRFKLKFTLGRSVPCSYLALVHDHDAAARLPASPKLDSSTEPLSELQRTCFPFLN
ncbi:hypothetical protein [Vibrio spartinae]|uniref:BioF2-like acetyltransferase domain-containing protein n=1 Tax=Vibrio spartinae TaxID=1918945 RepID=A0ABX6R3P9_9VIBR|nr:hypothetical protein [Vibrio spartinae]QMV16153.1 hypothetical protein Vspart_03538 [Vibrio spartinae]